MLQALKQILNYQNLHKGQIITLFSYVFCTIF